MNRREAMMSWYPVALAYLGILGVLFVSVVWLLTDRLEPALLAFFGSIIGIGEGVGAIRDFISNRPVPQDLQDLAQPSTLKKSVSKRANKE